MGEHVPLRPYIPRTVFRRGDDFLRLVNQEFRSISEDFQRFAASSHEVEHVTAGMMTPHTGEGVPVPVAGSLVVPPGALGGYGWWGLPRFTQPSSKVMVIARWSKSTSDTGRVCWGLAYKWGQVGAVPVVATSYNAGEWVPVCQDNNTAGQHLVTILGIIDIENVAMDPLLHFEVGRTNIVGTDSYGADAYLHALSFIYLRGPKGTKFPQPETGVSAIIPTTVSESLWDSGSTAVDDSTAIDHYYDGFSPMPSS